MIGSTPCIADRPGRSGSRPWVADSAAGPGPGTGSRSSRSRHSPAARAASTTCSPCTRHSDGQVWVGTRAGLVVLDPRQRKAERLDLSGTADEQPLVTTMRVDHIGRLWVGSLAHGVFTIDTGTRQAERIHLGPPMRRETRRCAPSSASRARNTCCWSAPGARACFARRSRRLPFRLLTAGPEDRGLRHENVTAVAAGDEPGRPWVGSFGGGPQRVDVEAGTVMPSGGDPGARDSGVGRRESGRDAGRHALCRYDRGTLPACGGRQRARPRCAPRGRRGQPRAGLRPGIAAGRR